MEYTTKSSTVHQKQEVTTSTEYTKSTNIADGSIQDTLTIYVNTSQVRQLSIYSWNYLLQNNLEVWNVHSMVLLFIIFYAFFNHLKSPFYYYLLNVMYIKLSIYIFLSWVIKNADLTWNLNTLMAFKHDYQN